MKYIIILMDGVADYRIDELGGKTPLEYAKAPSIKKIAAKSEMGLVKTVPDGMAPGSDVANLSVMGYDPGKYYTGRSSIEAVNLGIDLSENDVSFRCNLVTLSDEEKYADRVMIDYSAGEIPTDEAGRIIKDVAKNLETEKIHFFAGVSYRNIILWKDGTGGNILTPPHDILEKKVLNFLPEGPGSGTLLDMMKKSTGILKENDVNRQRIKKGLNPANSIWIWGEGRKPSLDSFYEKYKLKGSIISAVDLINGIGILAGLSPVKVKGATGTINTNFKGKASAAIRELKGDKDFVYLHLEATDECSHQGSIKDKVKAIEIIDRQIVGPVKEALDKGNLDYRMMILPDHYTPLSKRTHTAEPVPFLIYDNTVEADNSLEGFNEFSAKKTGIYFDEGCGLADYFFNKPKP
ncbi:MAG: cofactor-independent phosphoglycerate mutase [Actinomycetota bacterium]|nr:cofactor-independent phosphoglycerate mutase [Actinomycetota bacterium]